NSDWHAYSSGGIEKISDQRTASTVDTQSFTGAGSYQWIKPTLFTPTITKIILYGPGGGGGAGGSVAVGSNLALGGGGGGGGAYAQIIMLTKDLGSQEFLKVGIGGVGASGVANNTFVTGRAGASGTTTFFSGASSSSARIIAGAGGGGTA